MKAYVYMKTYMGLLVELYPKLPKLRTTQVPLSLKVYKLWYIHSMDVSIRKEQTADTSNNMDESQEQCKIKDTKFYIQHDSIYMTFWKRQNYSVGNHISSCLEMGKAQGKFEGDGNSLYLACFDMTICICQNSQNRKKHIAVYLKRMNFTGCRLYYYKSFTEVLLWLLTGQIKSEQLSFRIKAFKNWPSQPHLPYSLRLPFTHWVHHPKWTV